MNAVDYIDFAEPPIDILEDDLAKKQNDPLQNGTRVYIYEFGFSHDNVRPASYVKEEDGMHWVKPDEQECLRKVFNIYRTKAEARKK